MTYYVIPNPQPDDSEKRNGGVYTHTPSKPMAAYPIEIPQRFHLLNISTRFCIDGKKTYVVGFRDRTIQDHRTQKNFSKLLVTRFIGNRNAEDIHDYGYHESCDCSNESGYKYRQLQSPDLQAAIAVLITANAVTRGGR
jgi:hypothetical protein